MIFFKRNIKNSCASQCASLQRKIPFVGMMARVVIDGNRVLMIHDQRNDTAKKRYEAIGSSNDNVILRSQSLIDESQYTVESQSTE
jgi:hypothetical protein